jgi:outer membrane lipoprotein SlyB
LKQQVLVFSLGALAAVGVGGWLRSVQPVAVVTPATFQPAQPMAQPFVAPVIDEPVIEGPVEPAPVWRDESASTRSRRASHRAVRRAAVTSETPAAAVENRPIPADEPRLNQRESRRTESETAHASEPKLRERPSGPAESDSPETQRDTTASSQPAPVSQPDPIVRERSRKASAAIIAGSAAAGALIGAAAGRGKGAAIGAISGAAGGYVYDRMTHRKTERPAASRDSVTNDTSSYRDNDPRYGDEDTKIDTFKRVGVGAAGGAVIGGLAGHGRGAAIGALSGGAAGYIYDRLRRR